MPLKRTDKDGWFDYQTDEEFSQAADRLAEETKKKAEELIDIFYANNSIKAMVEIAWIKGIIDRHRVMATSIDRLKQQLLRILVTYE